MNLRVVRKTMKQLDPDFKHFLVTNFPEHAKRILKANSKAWFARIFFPMIFFLIPAAFFIAIAFFVYCIKQPNMFIFQNMQGQDKIADLVQNIPLRSTLISVLVTGGFVTLFCFFIGLIIGFSRAHYLLFEAEKLELSAKQLWLTEKGMPRELKETSYTPPVIKSPLRKETNKFQEPEV